MLFRGVQISIFESYLSCCAIALQNANWPV
jgi:hypothetical protein